MNGFRKLQERLTNEGWYVEWNLPCCQSCAWAMVPLEFESGPFMGKDVDLSKVLFNHSQDCEYWPENEEECPACEGEGLDEDDDDCPVCFGTGYVEEGDLPEGMIKEDGFTCYPPELQNSSLFCFAGDKEGVENLKAILPIIKECGCDYHWDETGDTRIEISW